MVFYFILLLIEETRITAGRKKQFILPSPISEAVEVRPTSKDFFFFFFFVSLIASRPLAAACFVLQF